MANVRVALRVRPLSKRENAEGARIILNADEKIARIRNLKLDYKPDGCGDTRERLIDFGFDYCYWSVDPEDPKYASQEVVFQDLGTTVLSEAIKGYNVCLFAYGQTGSGKTYTMMGTPASIGLTPRICEGLFSYNDDSSGTPSSCRIEVSFLEIYNERVRDLLHPSDQKKPYTLRVREHPEKGPYVQGLSQHVVTDYEQVVALLEQGMENRITAATHVHDASSRSHAIFTIQYTQAMFEDNLPSEITSKINLVDLAGSERASPNYCKDRLTEGSNINRSLVTLGIVISALAQNSQMTSSCQSINSIISDGDSGIPGSPSGSSMSGSKHQPFVPYRDSILTWLLKDSLGGNSKTVMIATVSPASSSYNETMSTLRYASNAKNIINKPRVNEDANVKLIRELREEINRLKAMLRNFEMSIQRTISPSFSEERDGSITELVLQNELKIEQLTKDWTDKWTDKAALMEKYNVDIDKGKARVIIDSSLPHLIAMDDDILSTGVVIYHLREGTTNIGRGDHDIVLQGECIELDHCVIKNKFGVVELRPVPGALCTVNGQEVKDVCRLSQGAVIVLGKLHRFRFNHPAEAAVLRQIRSDSPASFVNDCSLDWLDLTGDFSSSNENSLILNTRTTEPLSKEYLQRLRDLEASYRQQVDDQQRYVEDLKRQIQAAQVKGEKELEHEQSIINQQIQENQQWLVKEEQRLTAACEQRRDSASQTEPKTYVEAEVQNCTQTDIQPSPEEQDRKKLLQLELLRKSSLRKAERNIRRKRVKLQLERIVKKQKLLEAKKTLQQLQAACWITNDTVKPASLHVPKVHQPSDCSTALHRSRSSPSGFSYYRRCPLPWTLPTPPIYSALLKRKCKSELVHNYKIRKDNKPLRSVSIDCLLKTSCNYGSYGQLDNGTSIIGTARPQLAEKGSIDSLTKQINIGFTLLPNDPQISKTRQKMDKTGGRSKGSSNNSTTEPPKRRNMRATVSTGTKDTKLKALKSPSIMTVGGPKKSTVQEKSKLCLKNEGGKSPPQKSTKNTQKSPGQGKTPSGESLFAIKTARRNMAFSMPNLQKKPSEGTNNISSSVDNICKLNNHRGDGHTSDKRWVSTERLSMGHQKTNIQTLENWKEDDNSDSSDSESFYSVDSLSSAYASALTEQLKQEELERQRNTPNRKDSDSEDSQISQDSLVEKDNRKERPNKRRFNKYKTIVVSSSPSKASMGDQNSFPLVTTGSITTGLSKSFSLDSLADAEEVPDSSEELPAEIFWKLQSPRCLVLNGEDQKKGHFAPAGVNNGLDRSDSFYLKMNDGSVSDYSDISLDGKTKFCPTTLSNVCGGKSQQIHDDLVVLHSACISFGLASQNSSPEPTVNTLHGDSTSVVPTLNCAPKTDSHFKEDEMKQLFTKDDVKVEPQSFPDIPEALNTQAAQNTELHDKQVKMCNLEESERNTSDNTVIPNQNLEQKAKKQENVNEFLSTPPDASIKHNQLDNACSTVNTVSENQGFFSNCIEYFTEGKEEPQRCSPDNDIVALDLESICNGISNSISSQELSLDLTKGEKTSYTENKDDLTTSVEVQVACGKDVSCRRESQEKDTETLVLAPCDKIISTQLNVTNTNKSTSSMSNKVMSDISLLDQKEKCETREMFILPLTQGHGKMHYHNDTTAKNFHRNTNVTIAMSACVQLDNLKNQNQSLSSTCPESITSPLLMSKTLDSESIQKNLIGIRSLLKVNDQEIICNFKTAKLLSQIQVATVQLDINANRDCITETQVSPVFDTNSVFKNDNGAGSNQRHTNDGLSKIAGAGNNNTVSTMAEQLFTVEEKSHIVLTDQSEADHFTSPVEYNSLSQQKEHFTISSFPASHHSIARNSSSISKRNECGSGQSNEDTQRHIQSNQSYCSVSHASQETAVEGICRSPVPEITDHLFSDNYSKDTEQTLSSSNPVIDDNVSAKHGNILRNPDETFHMSELADNSFEKKPVATSPSSHIPEDAAANIVNVCLHPNFRTNPEVHDVTYSTPYIKSLQQNESSSVSSLNDVCIPPCNVSGKVVKQQDFCEAKMMLPEDRVLLRSETESLSAKTSCFIHKAEELPHIQNTQFLSPEYTNDKNQNNTESLPKTHSEEISVSHGTNQADRAKGTLTTHEELFPNSEADKQCRNSSTINVTADRDPLLCNKCHCEDTNCQIHSNNYQKTQVVKELMEENIVSKTEDPPQLNENIPIKHKSDKGVSEMKSEKDISNTNDSASSPSTSNHQKHFSGSLTDNNKEQSNTADVSYTGVNCTQQERYDCADHHLTEDISGRSLPFPYYETIMQNKLLCEPKYQSENRNFSTHSEKESSKNVFLSEQTGLNTMSSSTLSKLQENDSHADYSSKENDKSQCSGILKFNGGRVFFNPQIGNSELSISYGTGECLPDNQCTVKNSSVSTLTNVLIPKLHDVSYIVKYSDTKLDGAICSDSVIGKWNYFQSRSQEAGEKLDHHTWHHDKAQENGLLQQKHDNQNPVDQTFESASIMDKVDDLKERTSIVSSQNSESAPCRSEANYSVLNSKNTNNLPNATSFDTSQCCTQSDKLQEVAIDPLKNHQCQQNKDKCTLTNLCSDTESNVGIIGSAYCGTNTEDKMSSSYQSPCRRSFQEALSVDEVNLEHNLGSTSNVSHFMTNKNECELELLTDNNTLTPTDVFETSRVNSIVTCDIQQSDPSIAAGDKCRENDGVEANNLMSTVVCGEYCSELDKSPESSSCEDDTETPRSLVSRDFTGLSNSSVENLSMWKGCELDSCMDLYKETVNDIPQPAHFKQEMSPNLTCTKAQCRAHQSLPATMSLAESHLNESSIFHSAKSLANPNAETLTHESNFEGRPVSNEHNSKLKSKQYAPHTVTDYKVHNCLTDANQPSNLNVNPQHNSVITDNLEMEDVGSKACLASRTPTKILSNVFSESSHQANNSAVELVENTEGLHFSSSDINPFVHSWQQEENPKPGWRNCTFNSASDVSCTKLRAEVDKLIRCSSVDEGLNAHNSPFHSHLSSYANAKTVSSTISSFGGNDSRPDSMDGSQELLSDETAAICSGAEFVGTCGLQTKFEDYSHLDEIMILYTSDILQSETCNEVDHRVSCERETQSKQKHRRGAKHQRGHTDESSSRMRNRNLYQRPASWSNVQNMSLHLSQLLQETSELLGNLSQHQPENVYLDATKMQRDAAELILKRSVRDSSTQTSVDKGIQTDSDNNAQNHAKEHNSSGINVFVKVVGTDSLTPQNTCLTVEENDCKGPKTRTHSLPNLHEFVSCKQSEHGLSQSPQVGVSTPLLNNFQDISSTALPLSFSRSSLVSSSVNKDKEDLSHNVVISPSSSVVHTPRYYTTCRGSVTMVDRASSPILTLRASKKTLHKSVPENHLNNQNLVKILCHRKRRERGMRDPQVNSSQTETDSESFSSYGKSNIDNEFKAPRSNSLKELSRKRTAIHKVQRFMSEGCILQDTHSPFTKHYSSNSEISGVGKRCNEVNHFTSAQGEKTSASFAVMPPWECPQSLESFSQMSQRVASKNGQVLPQGQRKELCNDENDLCSFTITSSTSYVKNKNDHYAPSQISGFDLSVAESDCNTEILLGQEPTIIINQKPQNYALQNLPLHNKFSNWSGVQCSTPKSIQPLRSSADLNMRDSSTTIAAPQEELDSRSREIERLQRERAEVMSGIHLEMNPQPLTVQLAEAKLSYGIGETDALLRVIQTGKMDGQDTVSIKKQLYERHLQVIENLRKEREDRLQRFRRSRSLSPQKQLSASQSSLTSLREYDLPSRRREYLQQLRRDIVDNTRIQEPKKRASQYPSEIEVMLKDYQKAREEAKTEIARARDKLRERAELEKRRLQQSGLLKEDTKMKKLVSTSTLFTGSSLSLSSGPTSGYNSGMTATLGNCSKLGSQEAKTSPRSLDQQLRSARGRSTLRNCHLSAPSQSASGPDPEKISHIPAEESSPPESSPGKTSPCSLPHTSPLQSTPASYQGLATQIQASAMSEVMAACSYDLQNLYSRQAAAGWIYQSTEKDVLVYYKAFSSPTKHGFIGAGVIQRPLHDVWCMVKDINTRQLYDQSVLSACVHQRLSSSMQLVHVVTDTSLCYLKQPRDFYCLTVESKEEKCSSLCFQSLYNESIPQPNKDTVRGELMPSAWILHPDTISGETVTRVIYMVQVDLGAPAIPSRLLSVVSKRQPLVVATLANFLAR